MKYSTCYLPSGQKVHVSPVLFGFRFTLLTEDPAGSFPPEWTVSLSTKQRKKQRKKGNDPEPENVLNADDDLSTFKTPTLDSDVLYLSSMSKPHGKDLKPSSATTRQVAIILWVTFNWYFHEPEPESTTIPDKGRINQDWRLTVKQKGILAHRNKMFKLERLGLLACEDASVGTDKDSNNICDMFISQRAFWQLDPRLYLVSLTTNELPSSSMHVGSISSMDALGAGFPFEAGPKTFGMFLPSYYPSQPQQYTSTTNVRHPIRPKSYRQGEVFYVRYHPGGGRYLTFRLPVLPNADSRRATSHFGGQHGQIAPDLCLDSELWNDVKLLHEWVEGRSSDSSLTLKESIPARTKFFEERLSSSNSFPLLACWGSTPMGFFELFWVPEDDLGRTLGDSTGWDRGIRCLIGDTTFLSPYCIKACLSSLVHHCLQYDQRTQVIMFVARADNTRYVRQRHIAKGIFSW
ncbi:hypothetical protein VN97_g13165 [Penicillium thymicola]|uniref:Uncharacterized protein n=1 Tax=Penicillium thymicola TaxID=293382 RepID=A0AAI9T4C4_PENTH|nr:hypothetical protein VN97_g13165 [Penicillium thymicola]